jgi:uncharacterized damage-inducible protein DinB
MEISLNHFLKYNLWANTRLAALIPDEAADVELISSFPTIRKTLYHMWDAQEVWLNRLNGAPVNHWPSENFNGTFNEAKELFIQSSQKMIEFILAKDDSFFKVSLAYTNMKGITYTNTHEEILMHVCNHATLHRGQIITMLRNAGVTSLQSTDMITYFRENK